MRSSQTSYKDRVSKLVGWGHWFTFACVFAALIVSFKYLLAAPTSGSVLATIFLITNWIGHISFLSFAVFITLVFPLAFVVVWSPLYRLLAAAVASICLILLLVDAFFYSQFQLHLNIFTFEAAFAESFKLMEVRAIILVAAFITIFLLLAFFGQKLWQRRKTTRVLRGAKVCTWIFSICFFASHLTYIFADAYFYAPITSQRYVFPLSYPTTAKSFLDRIGVIDFDKQQQLRLQEDAQDNTTLAGYDLSVFKELEPKRLPNVVVFVIDAWRESSLTAENMPVISELVTDWQREHKHISSGNNNFEGLFGLLYGIPPRYWKQVKREMTPPALSKAFTKLGYQQGWFTSQKHVDLSHTRTLYSNFDFFSIGDLNHGNATNDRQTLKRWQKWISQKSLVDVPVFSMVKLTSANTFATPSDYRGPFTPDLEGVYVFRNGQSDDKQLLINRYKNSVHYIDSLFSDVAKMLDSEKLANNTLIVITGSHGQELDDRNKGIWGDGSNHSPAQIHVPFLIHDTDQPLPLTESRMTSHYDLSATVLNLIYDDRINTRDLSSGIDLFSPGTHDWILLGGGDHFALIEPHKTVEIDQFGNYKVYDVNYKRDREGKLGISALQGALKETTRFLSASEK